MYCERTADMIVSEQTPARLLEVRGRLYELLVHAIPAALIFKTLTHYLVKRVDETLRASLVEKAAFYVRRKEADDVFSGTAQCNWKQTYFSFGSVCGPSHVSSEITLAGVGYARLGNQQSSYASFSRREIFPPSD